MTAAKMIERPSFDLMHQDETRSHQYMQMPLWLFDDPRCADLSLDAKVIYTLLLNRFCLSCRNNWTNEHGEVFVVYPRQELATMLHICEQRVSAAMRALIDAELIWERRCGRGFPNQIYIARINDEAGDFAPDQEPQNQPDMPLNTCDSKPANSEYQEPQDLMPNKIKNITPDMNHLDVSQSSPRLHAEVQTWTDDERSLDEILAACELAYFSDDVALVFESAIEQLFYSSHIRIGNATIPQHRVRARLCHLDNMILRTAEQKLRSNVSKQPRNSSAYIMAVLYTCITEHDSDIMVDPDLNSM